VASAAVIAHQASSVGDTKHTKPHRRLDSAPYLATIHIMKIATIIVRTLMGLMFLFSSSTFFFKFFTPPELKGVAKTFMDGMQATTYFLPLLMGTQMACGLAFVTSLFVPLATIVIFPITLNILLYHVFVDPKGLPVAIPLILGNLFLAIAYRKSYAGLLSPRAK
jgi:putative oxidoreductase